MAGMEETLTILVEMGFEKEAAVRALEATKDLGSTVEAAINWLEQNQSASNANADSAKKPDDASSSSANDVKVITLKCEECGKLFRSQDDAVIHAEKTKHEKFSESTDELKPLTDEEKKARAAHLEERFNEVRRKKEQEEEQANLNSEINRRQAGKNIQDFKRKFEEDEIKRAADEKRREKEADKLAKAKILAQIEQDKRERAMRAGKAAAETTANANQASVAPQPSAAAAAPKVAHDSARLQVRLPTGETLQQSFAAKEPLAAVRLFVQMQRPDLANFNAQYTFMTNFPKKVFSEAEMEMPLDALGLVPSAALIVCRK